MLLSSLLTSLKESTTQNNLSKAFNTFSLILHQTHHHSQSTILLQSLASLLACCSQITAISQGKQLHAYAISSGLHTSPVLVPKLATFYSVSNLLNDALIVTESSNILHPLPWNVVISGHVKAGLRKDGLSVYKKMVSNLQHGKEFHCYIIKHEEFKDYLLLFNSLIDMYSRSGKILLAKRLFDSLTYRDEVSYTSLIAGYGIQGEGQTAVDFFEKMIRSNIKPDHVTMVAILSACSHSALVDQGQALFKKMCNEYNINPRLEHYSCMVDLYARAGLLSKAEGVISTMPYESTPAMWAAVIGGCRIHGNKELGEYAAEKMLELKPRNAGYYVLMANLYADYGNWEKLAKVRVLMRELGVNKVPGCAWLDVGFGFMEFLAADTRNIKAVEIYNLLDGLSQQLKKAGYILSFDKDEFMEV